MGNRRDISILFGPAIQVMLVAFSYESRTPSHQENLVLCQ